jgi:hypothetical protein
MAKEKESKVVYENEIVTIEETYEKQLDMSKVPVFTIENCEVLYSSLNSKQAKYGHNIQILLPQDTVLPQKDREIRNKYLVAQQKQNPNLEVVKGIVKSITNQEVLDGKYDEKLKGRYYIDIKISNTCMFDKTKDEDGKDKFTKIDKAEKAIGTPVVKYFRVIDKFTGKGINPEVFKFENGEKVTSFISPKTKQETPLYVNKGDTINITIRPFGVKNNNTGEFSLKYNLLKIEIVQTAWDKGIGRTGGGSSKVKEATDVVAFEDLDDIFGGTSTTTTKTEEKPKATPKAESKPEPKQESKVEATKSEITTDETDDVEIDFSALADMDMSSLNLGE